MAHLVIMGKVGTIVSVEVIEAHGAAVEAAELVAGSVRDGMTGVVVTARADTVVQANGRRGENAQVVVAGLRGEAEGAANWVRSQPFARGVSRAEILIGKEKISGSR